MHSSETSVKFYRTTRHHCQYIVLQALPAVCFFLVSWLVYSSTLNSKTVTYIRNVSKFFWTARRYVTAYSTVHTLRREHLKSIMFYLPWSSKYNRHPYSCQLVLVSLSTKMFPEAATCTSARWKLDEVGKTWASYSGVAGLNTGPETVYSNNFPCIFSVRLENFRNDNGR
jgi:hypothetical protein